MTLKTETASPSTGSNGGDDSDATITRASQTSESSSSNRGRRPGWGGCTGRGGHQGRGGQVGRFNRPAYISSIRNFMVEVEDFGAVLGTASRQRKSKDQCKKFSEKLEQYILREFQKPEDIIILVRYLKTHYCSKHIKTHSAVSRRQEIPDHGNDPNWRYIKKFKKGQPYGKT